MRNKTKTLFIGGAFACIGSLSGHGETFREKLDAYFAEHHEEIQKSIQAWDNYNLRELEYRITEKELKDVVMRSYEKTIDWMKRSMQHQISFFDYHREHLREGDTASLKKRFDCEQIRIHALQELGDMIEKFAARGIDYPKLTQYQQECIKYVPNPESLDGLRDHLLQNVGRDDDKTIAGGRWYYQHTENDRYAIKRLNWFFGKILSSGTPGEEWTGKLYSYVILCAFHDGYYTFTKWNPNAYPAFWRASTPPYPNCCLRAHGDAIDRMFANEGLIQTYGKVMKLLPECVNDACRLYRIYRDTLAALSAIKAGKLEKSQDWYGKILKSHKALFTYWLAQYYAPLADAVKTRNEFETVADALKEIEGCLKELHNKVETSIAQ